MEQIFYAITTIVSVVLMVLTLQRLLSGWWRRYYLLVFYLILNLSALVPPVASYVSNGIWRLSGAQTMYWSQALAAQVSLSLLVLQFIHRVTADTPSRSSLVRVLTIASSIAVIISVTVHMDKRSNAFMSALARDLTFLAAILNMVLWRFLMQLRKREFLVLAVSAGLGIQCTGDAIGHSLRILARETGTSTFIYEFGNVLMSLTAVASIAIWHAAFSRSKYRPDSREHANPSADSQPETSGSNTHTVN